MAAAWVAAAVRGPMRLTAFALGVLVFGVGSRRDEQSERPGRGDETFHVCSVLQSAEVVA
jgi:hypothetical protein